MKYRSKEHKPGFFTTNVLHTSIASQFHLADCHVLFKPITSPYQVCIAASTNDKWAQIYLSIKTLDFF